VYLQLASLLVVSAILLTLANCGNTVRFSSNPSTGRVTLTITDPPRCRFPSGEFKHVFITIRSAQAHISSTASDNSSGWQELAPQLTTEPKQVDLLGLPTNGCLLAELGSTKSLPVGDYQQIRLLRSNDAASTQPMLAPNACGGHGFNCVVLSDDTVHEILLSSEADTGLKIPPGQIVGGPIRVEAGKDVDINIDFNACAALLPEGNGAFRLKPALTAGQVQTNTTGISGQVVDSLTKLPIVGKVLVALEQTDGTGTDHVVMPAATADANGNFNFCPLATGTYDLVAVAISTANNGKVVAYNATAVLNVPSGTALGQIPLIAETGNATGPGTITGTVTATTGAAAASIDVAFSALQTIQLSGGTSRKISIPLEDASTLNVAVDSSTSCAALGLININCAQYTLVVPASNPSFGTFAAAGFAFSAPAAGSVFYIVVADATKPTGDSTCTHSEQIADKDSGGQQLKVTAGATTTAQRIDFTGCS